MPLGCWKAAFPFFEKNENTVKTRVAIANFIAVIYDALNLITI